MCVPPSTSPAAATTSWPRWPRPGWTPGWRRWSPPRAPPRATRRCGPAGGSPSPASRSRWPVCTCSPRWCTRWTRTGT
ncbi:hypothetical protein V2I01_35190 [Micromonospora sp. BRA006-A]|nr:hypothetical protein [Micromonospora sp. BRA006-A]